MANLTQTRGADRVVDPHPLTVELAKVLPKDHRFTAYHLSTPPTTTECLCYPPAREPLSDPDPSIDVAEVRAEEAERPLRTYCEKHFLAISISAGRDEKDSGAQVLVLGVEIYIYTTSFSTIIFVSKADSTGYLHLLNLPKDTPSPIREITTCFLAFLVANRRRENKQLVVNLFARSQSQYLFPGSVKNSGKHVLDDRGLVKWWCRVLNSLLEDHHQGMRKAGDNVHGYLIVPGLDNYETRAFLPRTSLATTNWTLGHPLELISPYTQHGNTKVHPRSLIPTYPDDPKARFVEELEASTSEHKKLSSGWKTPKTLDEFWELMAFRQECSSGRLTGFMWLVFQPLADRKPASPTSKSSTVIPTSSNPSSAPVDNVASPTSQNYDRHDDSPPANPGSSASKLTKLAKPKAKKLRQKGKVRRLTGPVVSRRPRVKTHQGARGPKLIETPHYFWPENGRGQVVLDERGYNRAVELLLHLEFGTLKQAIASTARWTKDVNMGNNWALEIVGERAAPAPTTSPASDGTVNNLTGIVKRKREPSDTENNGTSSSTTVHTLGQNLVRKKAKLDADSTAPDADSTRDLDQGYRATESEPKATLLGAGLIRKKPKTS